MKTILLLLYMIAFQCSFGQDAQLSSMIDAKIKCQKPYLLIDLPSSDCINCRAEVSHIIKEIGGKVEARRLIILTDDNNMKLYFNKYPSVFGKYKIIVDSDLSGLLTNDYRSKLYLIGKDSMRVLGLTPLKEKSLSEVISNLQKKEVSSKASRVYAFTDTVFASSRCQFSTNESSSFIYSQRFQIGNLADYIRKINAYSEPKINSNTIAKLQKVIGFYHKDSTLPPDSTINALNDMTIPSVYIYSIKLQESMVYNLFYVNTISYSRNGNNISKSIRGRNFLGKTKLAAKESPLDIDTYSEVSLIDTFYYKGVLYFPYLFKGFGIQDSSIFLPVRKVRDSAETMVESRELLVGKFRILKNKKLSIDSIYSFGSMTRPADFSVTVDQCGKPVIVNYMDSALNFTQPPYVIRFGDILTDNNEMIDFVFDVNSIDGETFVLARAKGNVVYFKINLGSPVHLVTVESAHDVTTATFSKKSVVTLRNDNSQLSITHTAIE